MLQTIKEIMLETIQNFIKVNMEQHMKVFTILTMLSNMKVIIVGSMKEHTNQHSQVSIQLTSKKHM